MINNAKPARIEGVSFRRKLIKFRDFNDDPTYIDPDEILAVHIDKEKARECGFDFDKLTVLSMHSGGVVYLRDSIEIVADAINETRDR